MNTKEKDIFDDDEDQPIDPKKLFDEKEYNTLLVNRDGFTKKEHLTGDMMDSLLDKNTSRQESEDIFAKLKNASAQDLLVRTIGKLQHANEKSILTAACWESGLDFTPYFLFFVELALHPDFQLAIEALTVVQQIEGEVDEQTLNAALEKVDEASHAHPQIVLDLQTNIRSRF